MRDPRLEAYARLMVETCVGVQPGWQVLVTGGVLGRPLLEEVERQIARRGAYALMRVGFDRGTLGLGTLWGREAPFELLSEPAPLDTQVRREADAIIYVVAPENTRSLTELAPDRLRALQAGWRVQDERIFDGSIPWTGGQYPTPALAQEAGLATEDFAEILFAAVLRDWDAERQRMRRYAELFDAGEEVRIVGAGTDLSLSITGRSMTIDAAGKNLPGGEFFTAPIEDSAEGTIAFTEFPASYSGRELRGIRLRFGSGRVVDATAESEEEFLLSVLATDDGARGVGELGVGCNPGITQYMNNILFDEKIDGTVHVALGNTVTRGGTNVSAIHWDMVKDLRNGGPHRARRAHRAGERRLA
jgi:aminopeptidase